VNTDISVTCICQSQLQPLIQGFTLNCVLQNFKVSKSNRKVIAEHRLESYNVLSGKKEDHKELRNCKEIVCPRMLSYVDTVTILGSESDSGSTNLRVGLYKLKNTPYYSAWELTVGSNFTLSHSDLDIENTACVSYNNMVIIASVLNQRTLCQLILHLYDPSKKFANGSYWSSRSTPLRLHSGVKYEIQSCIVMSEFIYCSLLLLGTGAYIYKINLYPPQKCTTVLPPLQKCTTAPPLLQKSRALKKEHLYSSNQLFENKMLQNSFLVVGPSGNAFNIAVSNKDMKTIVKVERLIDIKTFSFKVEFAFPSIVKAITASAIPNYVIIIYHCGEKCYIKKLKMTDK